MFTSQSCAASVAQVNSILHYAVILLMLGVIKSLVGGTGKK